VRNWLGAEQVLTYPQPSLKLTNGVATWLHFDHLGSVRAITDAGGAKVESAIYRPFGEQSEWLQPGTLAPETKGWIGERFDADAGLQYLNARYYDPALGLFLQPDWFEVTKPGVGTNRFSYSFNDPVNKFDPGGNQTSEEEDDGFWDAVGRFFGGFARGAYENADLNATATLGAGGAAGGALVGAYTGGAVGCGASACAASPITTPVGSGIGWAGGGLIGGGLGLVYDVGQVVAGGIVGGVNAVAAGPEVDGTKVLASPNPSDGAKRLAGLLGMVSTGLGTHANSLMSPRPTELYHLVRSSDPSVIDKIGITSTPSGGPTGRYTQAELEAMGVRYVSVATYSNRLQARIAEVAETLNYVDQNGRFPKYTFRW